MHRRMGAIPVPIGQAEALRDCQAIARALRVPSSQQQLIERAIRAITAGLTREATRAGLDVRAIILADRASRANKKRSGRTPPPTAAPPPTAPRVRID